MTSTDTDLLWRNLKDLPAFRGFLRAMEAQFYQDISLPEPVLDVGCGDAHFASITFDKPLTVGLDPWTLPLREARRRPNVYRLLVQADGGAMPFPSGWFASAISNSVLEHIPQVELVLAETGRVLRSGAPFILCVPNSRYLSFLSIPSALEKVGWRGGASAYRDWFRRMSRVSHADEPPVWQARLERAGFGLERHWDYFSEGAQHALEWGHYFGAPSLLAKALTGRWLLWRSRFNLVVTDWLVRRYFREPLPAQGAFTFYCARRR